ncbi:DUF6894 family protein [Methylobacterium sp. P31]
MAKFYFDLCRDGEKIVDQEGMHFENIGFAYRKAKQMVELLRQEQMRGRYPVCSSWVEVQYSDRSTIFKLPVVAAA